jgi:uncharacterized iron-regulated membrane protein
MEPTFRASMNWLHTWTGVVLAGLLFAIFWMGTLSVFDREIDRWMMPATRLALPEKPVPLDALQPLILEAAAARATFWSVLLPTDRMPMFRVAWRTSSGPVVRYLDPATGAPLPDPGTLAGTQFLYPFHYNLHIRFAQLGSWLVGFAGMAMLVLCVSGVIVHRKIFADFFTFRIAKKPRRLMLDLHNVAGVLGLPFHIAITLSGLIIFYSVYFSSVWQVAYQGDRRAFGAEAFDLFDRAKANKPGKLASLDDMVAQARAGWEGDIPRFVTVRNPGDAAAIVQVSRANDDRVRAAADVASFDGATGRLLHQRLGAQPMVTASRFISGLHLIQFRHWTLRWLYFGLGLLGCLLIATGLLFWLESRRRRHAQLGLRGVRVVEGLTVGSVSGILAATLAFFVVNRLLPHGAAFLGQERAALEVWTFYLVWLATFAHAWARPARAWIEQCWLIAVLAVASVLLNWITSGDHLGRSLGLRHLWPVGGIDMMLLLTAATAAVAARFLGRRLSAS